MTKTSLDDFPEIFVSTTDTSATVNKAVEAGRLRKIGTRLYTKNLSDAPEDIVRQNWHRLLKSYYPDALIADRTAIENRPAEDGSVFIISSKKRSTVLPGITFKPRKGMPPLEADPPFIAELRLSSMPRAYLENMRNSRGRQGSVPRTLSKAEMEERLDTLIRRGGEDEINRVRDDARAVADQLNMQEEFDALNEMIGSLLGTRDGEMQSVAGRARQRGVPFDPQREGLFLDLFSALKETVIPSRPSDLKDQARVNLAFFEAYFSNFIEGTEFEVSEAADIVFKGTIPTDRPEDAHDVLGTFRIVSSTYEMSRRPGDFDEFIHLLKTRHATFMELRQDKRPGEFKTRANVAGSTRFVDPDLVVGTLQKGFEIYRGLERPMHRAIFMMFLVSEVHPFADGNGRAARIMMNADLVASGETRIIIPTVYRTNYLSALKAITQNGICEPIIRTLDFAQEYTDAIDWTDYDQALGQLERSNAFMDSAEADGRGLRLRLPE
jgi:hypothetical protein